MTVQVKSLTIAETASPVARRPPLPAYAHADDGEPTR